MIAFDSTMTRYALRFRDGTIQVRRVADDREIARFQARGDRDIFVFGFSPDGRYLATTHFPDYALTVWDIDRGTVARERPGPVSGGRPNSARTAGGSPWPTRMESSSCTTWRPAGPAGAGTGRAPVRLAFRPTGPRSRSSDDEPKPPTCRILEAETGRLVRSFPLAASRRHVAWSPDGTTLATAVR